jgi:hypothetical protein
LIRLAGHSLGISSVAFAPDSQTIVTGSLDGSAKVWDADDGRELRTLSGHSSWILSVAYSQDGGRILTGSQDRTVRVWDAQSGLQLLSLPGLAPARFSSDGRHVAAALGTAVGLWEAASPSEVSAWKKQQNEDSSLMARRKREASEAEREELALLARDEGSIKKWLVLAPFPSAEGQNSSKALEHAFIDEAKPEAVPGQAPTLPRSLLKWREAVLPDYRIDFNSILSADIDHSVAYALCYLYSSVERRDLRILIGSDDQSKLYLNGHPIYTSALSRGFLRDEDIVSPVRLERGLNVLLLKVVNETSHWKASLRFTDALGNPVEGIKTSLRPDDSF